MKRVITIILAMTMALSVFSSCVCGKWRKAISLPSHTLQTPSRTTLLQQARITVYFQENAGSVRY